MAAPLFLGARKADKAAVVPRELGAFVEHYGAGLAFQGDVGHSWLLR